MTDEEYVFNQTSWERKRVGRGVFSQKKGSRSRKCSLTSDYLTAKQKKELNGEMISYNLERPMTWTEFKFLPVAIQEKYIINMRDKYKGRMSDIAEMMGTMSNTLETHMKKMGYRDKCYFGRGGKPYPSEEWTNFLKEHGKVPYTCEALEVQKPEVAEEAPVVEEPKKLQYIATNGSLSYRGDPAVIFSKMLNALDMSKEYEIKINFRDLTEF